MANYIHLNLPRSWNALTPEQVEGVAQLMIDMTRLAQQHGSFDEPRFFVKAFFLLSGLEVIRVVREDAATITDASAEVAYYECRYRDEAQRRERQTVGGVEAPIRIYPDEIMALTVGDIAQKDIDQYLKKMEQYQRAVAQGKDREEPPLPQPKGPLAWLLQRSTLTRLPWRKLTLADPDNPKAAPVTFTGPSEEMQDVKWRQYRFLTDIMSYLATAENELVRLQQRAARLSIRATNEQVIKAAEAIAEQQAHVNEVRAQFLATLYSAPVPHIDPETGLTVTDPWFVSSQSSANIRYFLAVPEARFQAISFWWQGMMALLQSRYPKVFGSNKPGSAPKDDDPFQLYTRSTTTMIKYAAANEEEVNNTTYTIILQHINDMAEENERIEQMKSKNS